MILPEEFQATFGEFETDKHVVVIRANQDVGEAVVCFTQIFWTPVGHEFYREFGLDKFGSGEVGVLRVVEWGCERIVCIPEPDEKLEDGVEFYYNEKFKPVEDEWQYKLVFFNNQHAAEYYAWEASLSPAELMEEEERSEMGLPSRFRSSFR